MNFFDHKDLGNHLLQLCPKVVKHPVFLGGQNMNLYVMLITKGLLLIWNLQRQHKFVFAPRK
jgi:hypothetical protein